MKRKITVDVKLTKALIESMTKFSSVLEDFQKKASKGFDVVADKLRDVRIAVGKADDAFEDLNSELKRLEVEKRLPVRKLQSYAKEIEELGRRQKKLNRQMREVKTDKEYEATIKSAAELKKDIDALTEKYRGMQYTALGAFEDMGGGIKRVSSLWSAAARGPSAVKEWAKDATEYANILKKWPERVKETGGALKTVGGIAGATGKVLGTIGRGLGGWGAAVVYALRKFIDWQLEVDRFVKNANKAFASIRGPDIMTRDVRKQMKEFNDQIYQIGENLAVGLNADQIRQFFESVYRAGQNITMLNTGLTTYRDAVYIAARASKTLSMELPEVGNIIGDLMTEFRMDLRRIDEAFVQVAFDAKKSGLSTDRFWSAVKNANASLAFYGVYIKHASKLMAKFSKAQVEGAANTAETVQDITQAFEKMDMKQRAAFAELVGNTSVVRGMFSDLARDLEKRRGMIAERLEKIHIELTQERDKKTADQITKLREEQDRLMNEEAKISMQIYNTNQAVKGSIFDIAQMLPMLSDRVPELLERLSAQYGGLQNLSGEGVMMMNKIFSVLGLNADLVVKLQGYARQQAALAELQLGVADDMGEKQITLLSNLTKLRENIGRFSERQKKLLESSFKELAGAVNKSAEEQARIRQVAVSQLKELGFNEDVAGYVADLSLTDERMAKYLMESIMNMDRLTDDQIRTFKEDTKRVIKQLRIGDKMLARSGKAETEIQESLDEKATKTFDQLVKETLSLEEMAKIASEGINYRIKTLDFFQSINRRVGDIAGYLFDAKKEKSISQKQAEQSLALQGISIKWTKGYGYDLQQIADESRKSYSAIKSLAPLIETQTGALNYLKRLKEGETVADAVKAVENRIATLQADYNAIGKRMEEKQDEIREASSKGATSKNIELLTRQYDEMNEQYEQTAKEIAKQRNISGELKKYSKEDVRTAKQALLTEQEKNQKELTRHNEIIAQLKELEGAQHAVTLLMEALVMSNKTSREQFLAGLAGIEEPGKILKEFSPWLLDTFDEMLETTKASQGMGSDAVKTFKRALESERRRRGEQMQRALLGMGSLQGIIEPLTITAAAMPLIAHRGETLLPAPGAGGRGPGAGAAAPGIGERTININITATEKDLAQKIANEVRAVLYREQLVGAG